MSTKAKVYNNYTEEQELMIESIYEFCERHATEAHVREWYAEYSTSQELNKAYVDAGFGMMGIPEEFGGEPVDVMTRAIFNEHFTRACGVTMPNNGQMVVVNTVCTFGRKDQADFAMERYINTGTPGIALIISEPCAGSDNANMQTTVKNIDGKLILSGSKTFGSGLRNCDYMLVVAKDEDPSRDNRAMSMWLIPKNLPGIREVEVKELGWNLSPFSDVYFDDVVIDESHLLGERGNGFMQLMKNFEFERIICAAQYLGLAQAAMDDAAAYASQRVTFGNTIGSYQLIQEKLVNMEVKLQNIRNMLYKTASDMDKGESVQLSTALLKYYSSLAAFEVCNDAMQIMGGIGYTEECRVGRLWLEARGGAFAGGTPEIMIYISGRQLLKKYSV